MVDKQKAKEVGIVIENPNATGECLAYVGRLEAGRSLVEDERRGSPYSKEVYVAWKAAYHQWMMCACGLGGCAREVCR